MLVKLKLEHEPYNLGFRTIMMYFLAYEKLNIISRGFLYKCTVPNHCIFINECHKVNNRMVKQNYYVPIIVTNHK